MRVKRVILEIKNNGHLQVRNSRDPILIYQRTTVCVFGW
jgi:hypothetical protein